MEKGREMGQLNSVDSVDRVQKIEKWKQARQQMPARTYRQFDVVSGGPIYRHI